jgi:hypothetical protein
MKHRGSDEPDVVYCYGPATCGYRCVLRRPAWCIFVQRLSCGTDRGSAFFLLNPNVLEYASGRFLCRLSREELFRLA